MRGIAFFAAFVIAAWTGGVATTAAQSPVDAIPVFHPTASQDEQAPAEIKTPIDPLGPARNPRRPRLQAPPLRGTKRPRPTPATSTPSPLVSPSLTPAPSLPKPRLESAPSFLTATNTGCGASYPFGSAAVSVEGRGTFCAFSPVCSGAVEGHCPGKQPGLDAASRCAVLSDGAHGCVV